MGSEMCIRDRRKSSASSCMRYDFDHLPVHPVTAYASGDFQMLWTEDSDGKIASRCVVRVMPDGQYRGGPIYGVSEQAIDMLEHHIKSTPNGEYGADDAWVGARLLRQPTQDDPDAFYAPYLDPEPRRFCLLYTSPSPRDLSTSRMPSSA